MEAVLLIALVVLALPAMVFFGRLVQNWQVALFATMVLVVFEGALRKWVFPGLQGPIYFLKDAVLLVAIFGFLIVRRQPGPHAPLMHDLKLWLQIGALFFLMQVLNPNSPSFLVGLIGFKSYVLYTVLLVMVPYAFNSVDGIDTALKRFMLIAIPVAMLGLLQFALPGDHPINTYVKHDIDAEMSIAGFAGTNQVRTVGTFAYLGGYSAFLTVTFFLSMAYTLTNLGSWRSNWIPFTLLLATMVVMPTTGSRSLVTGTLGTAPIAWLLCMRAGILSGAAFVRLALAAAVVALIAVSVTGDAVDAFTDRANNSDSTTMRLFSPITQALTAFENVPVLGLGIGVTHNSVATMMGVSDITQMWWLRGNFFEDETARTLAEVGPLGFFLVYVPRILIFFWAVSMVGRLKTPLFKALSACIAAMDISAIAGQLISNPTTGLFFWFSTGLLFAMYRLDHSSSASRPVVTQPQALKPVSKIR